MTAERSGPTAVGLTSLTTMGGPVGAHRAAEGLTAGSASFDLDVGRLENVRPLARLGGEEGAELLGRGDVRLDAEFGQALPGFGGAQAGNDRAVELVDDVRRRAGGCQEPGPERQYEVGIAAFDHGGDIRQISAAGLAGDGKRSHLAVADVRQQRPDAV